MAHLYVQEEVERLQSCRAAGPSGRDEAAGGASGDATAAAALVYFRKLGHLASCAADLRSAAARPGVTCP